MKKRLKNKVMFGLDISSVIVIALDLAYVIFVAVTLAAAGQGTAFLSSAFKPFTISVIVLNSVLILGFASYLIFRKIKKYY